ncbi:hypothetical protein BD779DRAFT_1573405 [Infundibulicybe gibba]|nr:hypothetical protein BD779DRAFT_1573405 [Infundibulicybe gibba]
MRDLTVSRAVLVIYSMFEGLPAKDMEMLLGLAPGELFRSPAMQGLFGVGDEGNLELTTWLPPLLKNGSVKLQHDVSNNHDINDYIHNAHEHLALTCLQYVLSCADPQATTLGSYAMKYWASHLRHTKPSERLFETLRRVTIQRDDIEPVIESLEGGIPPCSLCLLSSHIITEKRRHAERYSPPLACCTA